MIFDGFKVMVIGMSIVFLFLYIIVIMIGWSSKIILKFSKIDNKKYAISENEVNKKGVITAVISSAISKHISKGRNSES